MLPNLTIEQREADANNEEPAEKKRQLQLWLLRILLSGAKQQ